MRARTTRPRDTHGLALGIALSLSSSSLAFAQAPDSRERSDAPDAERRDVAIDVNPLSLLIERYGANLQYSPA